MPIKVPLNRLFNIYKINPKFNKQFLEIHIYPINFIDIYDIKILNMKEVRYFLYIES